MLKPRPTHLLSAPEVRVRVRIRARARARARVRVRIWLLPKKLML
jgi:hypothetical protein